MGDIVDQETRSRMMSGIRAKNTRPELFLRKGLHALGFRYRLHVPNIPGKPDIVFSKYEAIVVVHGCYWHGHNCRYFKWPKSNQDFWKEKITSNKTRDLRDLKMQQQLGWRVLVVWECAVRRSLRECDFDVVDLVAQWIARGIESAVLDEKGVHYR
jgi:DNA mismatch endonuclease (patch repair protein)